MRKDDDVYLGHMLDVSHKALDRVRARTQAEYDADEDRMSRNGYVLSAQEPTGGSLRRGNGVEIENVKAKNVGSLKKDFESVRPVVSDVRELKGLLKRAKRKAVSVKTMNEIVRRRGGRPEGVHV